jgi:hypothetical protein
MSMPDVLGARLGSTPRLKPPATTPFSTHFAISAPYGRYVVVGKGIPFAKTGSITKWKRSISIPRLTETSKDFASTLKV